MGGNTGAFNNTGSAGSDSSVLTDALGSRHLPTDAPARIVSLVPSLTELLFALGLQDQIVGRTRYCIYPDPVITTIPVVGGTKQIKMECLRALCPSHVILNIDENPRELAEQLTDEVPHIIVTHPQSPEDNRALYHLLGGIFRRETEAAALTTAFDRALAALREHDWPYKKVLYLIWRKPWMGISQDTYIARTLALVGWDVLPVDSEDRYPVLTLDQELLDSTDLILFSSEPYPFQLDDLSAFACDYHCPLQKLRLIDAEMTSWYGNRAIEGLNYLGHFAAAVN